jgi:hypothetical protein
MMERTYLSGTLLISLVAVGWLSAGGPGLSKIDYYNQVVVPETGRKPLSVEKILGFGDRKRSVMDRGNMVLRLSNAATYGYDRWGLNHEFPAGSMMKDGCCTYYWTQSPIVGALINGQPSVAVGVRGSLRDSEEEFEPLPGYDAGYVDTEANIGIAFSDLPESWPTLWPIEKDPTGTYTDAVTGLSFPGVEPPLHENIRFPVPPFMRETFPADDPDKRIAYFVVTDNDPTEGNTLASNGVGPLNVRFDIWVVNDASVFANDGLIFIQLMTNVGPDTLKDLYMGIAGDPDTPEQGGQEWTDDLALFIEADDPHIAEKLVDTTDSYLLKNFALVWDSDDKAEGFKTKDIGWIGLKFLEATKIASDGTETSYDVSAFYTFEYSQDAQSDAQAYNEQLKAGIQTPHNISPYPGDVFEKPYSYGPDITWVIAAGPMDIAPGEQVIFTFADFMGVNEKDLISNAKLFQSYYDNKFRTPKPPPAPSVHAIAGDGQVALFWDAGETESALDPVTGNNAFEGYRIYRSTDRGKSWGKVITNVNGNPSGHYLPLAIYDKVDNITGPYPMGDFYYNLGSDVGLRYSYVDKNVVNGYEYWYAVCAYDAPDDWAGTPVQPLENPKATNAFIDGDNTVAVIPQASPAGYDAGEVTAVTHTSGESDAILHTYAADAFTFDFLGLEEIYEEDFISKGHEYDVTFHVQDDTVYYWTLVNTTTGDTVVAQETDVESGTLKYVIDGFVPVFENGSWEVTDVDSSQVLNDTDTTTQVVFSGVGVPGAPDNTWFGFISYLSNFLPTPTVKPSLADLQRDLEIRFTADGAVATFVNTDVLFGMAADTIMVPFELWDVENNQQLNAVIYSTAAKPAPLIAVVDSTTHPNSYQFTISVWVVPVYSPYNGELTSFDPVTDTDKFGWVLKLGTETQFEYGNVLRVYLRNPLIPGADVYHIATTAPDYTVQSKRDLDDILVVPNPYVASSVYETNIEVKEIQFTHLPDECVIRIFTLAGELVRVLKHEPGSEGYRGPSVEAWNLRTYNDQEVAFGVYLFHVMADDQEKIGKFAVIR